MKRYIRIDGVIYDAPHVDAKVVTLEEVVETFIDDFLDTLNHPLWSTPEMIQVLEDHVRSLASAIIEHPKPPEPELFP